MAKKSSIARNQKRIALVERYAAKRAQYKAVISNPNSTDEEFQSAQLKLSKLPKNSSPIRVRNRCSVTGRPRAYVGKFGLSRITFRELASQGRLPGVTRSSW